MHQLGPSNIINYPAPNPRPVKKRPGFSLVLTLIILAMLTLTVLLSAAFINIESRLAMQNHLATRARMNAVSSLRLAMAHLQQEAGPDRRVTARADITADQRQPGWTWTSIRNPLWTGVWRSDRPLQPPAWLVSGRHDRPAGAQSVSLFGVNLSNVANYDGLLLAPWDNSYSPAADNLVTLVGDASASGAVNQTTTVAGKPDGRIRLPRVPMPDAGANGNYAYWIGDEGVKARLDLRDPRTDPATATDQTRQEALRGVGRTGVEILAGLENTPAGGIDPRVRSFQDLSLLTSANGLNETSPPTVVRRLQTETTFWSRGVNCDSQFGGLKIDLSNAFELSDADWARTEFAAGTPPLDSAGQPLAGVTYLLNAYSNTLASPVAFGDNKINVPYDGADHRLSTVYTFAPYGPSISSTNRGLARGPTWDALRNYYQLYKEVDWSNGSAPLLRARTHFPNTRSFAASGYGGTAHYSHYYARMDTADNFTVLDRFNAQGVNKEAPRPVRVSVSPYVSRQLLVWGLQEEAGQLRLTLTPITVLHNPYNVALRLENPVGGAAAMRLSFRFWDNWTVNFSTTSRGSWTQNVGNLARSADPTANVFESFRTYIGANTVLQPGEFRVFSSSGSRPDPFTRTNPPIASNNYNFLGGFWLPWVDPAGNRVNRAPTDTISAQMTNSGQFFVRHLLTSWPGDSIMETGNSNDSQLYNACSEVTELSALNLLNSGNPAAKLIPAGTALPGPGAPPLILAVFDYGVRWARDPQPFPLFSHSNPMATSQRADATGISPGDAVFNTSGTTFATTSPSFKMVVRSANSWSEVMEATGPGASLAFWGMSVTSGSGGQSSAVYTEVPLGAPLGLAQFAHANFTIRDHEPLLAIGNSFAATGNAINEMGRTEYNATTWDHAWMLNAALFDRFYLSGAAPEITRGSKVSEKRALSKVLDDFVAGTGTLANPRTVLWSKRDAATVRAMVGNHRRIAGATLTEGSFNVNSTSVEAWTAVLAGAKRNAMGKAGLADPSNTQNARFPRAARADKAGYNFKSPFTAADAWTGLATLDDGQIRLLARSVVDEIRKRSVTVHRSPVQRDHPVMVRTPKDYDCQKDLLDIPIPFTGMAQFVNRNLCGWQPVNTATSMNGCLQNAITRADVDGANLSNRSANPAPEANAALLTPNGNPAGSPWVNNSLRQNVTMWDPRNSSTNRGHVLAGAPTSLTQADILAAIGPGLATRSDTFVIRCYGEATNAGGGAGAGCWIEAVVQRTPEFHDASQPAETEVCDPLDSFKNNPKLLRVNSTLGRRFQVVSLRTLSPQEL